MGIFFTKKARQFIVTAFMVLLSYSATQAAYFYTADATNGTVGSMGLSAGNLGSSAISNPSNLTSGIYNYNYAAIIFTPTADNTYTFGQTFANADTVMILYSGIFDPGNPGQGGLVGNNDTNQADHESAIGYPTSVSCSGSSGLCPQVMYGVAVGNTYTLLVSTFSPGSTLVFPFQFYSTGDVIFGAYTPGMSPINMNQAEYLASEIGVTVTPDFVGGTLKMDTADGTYADDFTVSSIASNTIDQNGNDSTFTGEFSDAVTGTPGVMNISNSGSGGSVTFAGVNTYTGVTNVNSGVVLYIDGTHAGDIDVLGGGTLGGTGSTGDVTVRPGGIIAPGNKTADIATMQVANITFEPGAILWIDVDPGDQAASDMLHVTGTADLGNATVAHVGLNETDAVKYGPEGQWRILTADGGFVGAFAAIDSNYTFLDAELIYDSAAKWVDVKLTRNDKKLSDFAHTFNQKNVAGAIDNMGSATLVSNGLLNAILMLPDSTDFGRLLDQLSGEIYATAPIALINQDMRLRAKLLRQAQTGALHDKYKARSLLASLTPQEFTTASAKNSNWNFWVEGGGDYSRYDSTRNAGKAEFYGPELLVGADVFWSNNWQAGIALRYADKDLKVKSRSAHAEIQSYSAGVYLSKGVAFSENSALRFTGGGLISYHELGSTRHVHAFNERLEADYNARSWEVFLEAAYNTQVAYAVWLEPFVNVAYNGMNYDAVKETGGLSALAVKSKNFDNADTQLGARATISAGEYVNLYGEIAWQHTFGDIKHTSNTVFRDYGDRFSIKGDVLNRDAALVNLGANIRLSGGVDPSAGYNGGYGDRGQSHGGFARITFNF